MHLRGMPKRYSNDLRDQVLAYKDDSHTQQETCAVFGISRPTLNTWLKLRREAGSAHAHPFDKLRRGAWKQEELGEIIELVDAIEVFNARCFTAKENEAAADYAQAHNVLGTVGSDAHAPVELGKATQLMSPFTDMASFAEALNTAQPDTRLSPWWVHGLSSVAKWQRKYLKRPQPLPKGNQY